MSHVLALLPHTPGKYELKYELTTLIYPFEKQRTSSPVEGSREIAQLLVPTDPGGADRGWDGTLSLHEWVWPSWYYTHITNTHTQTHTSITHWFFSEANMDQFLLYEGSRLLKTRPEGHQMGVKQWSTFDMSEGACTHCTRVWRWGVIYGGSVMSQHKGCNERSFTVSVFSNLCAQILHV